jgi:hypothetical protein
MPEAVVKGGDQFHIRLQPRPIPAIASLLEDLCHMRQPVDHTPHSSYMIIIGRVLSVLKILEQLSDLC